MGRVIELSSFNNHRRIAKTSSKVRKEAEENCALSANSAGRSNELPGAFPAGAVIESAGFA
jgi:hypothetical protein